MSLLDRVWELGARFPDASAVAFVDERGRVTESMNRAEVVAETIEVADSLSQRCGLAPGDRALLVYPPGLDFVRVLLGCIAVGVLPVPVYPPDPINPQRSIGGFQRIAADCGAKAVLTSRRYAGARRLGAAKSFVTGSTVDWPTGLSWHVISRGIRGRRGRGLGHSPPPAWGLAPSPDTPALLQYTSGSTSDPKGVVITHGNLTHQFDFNRRLLGLGLDSRGVFWVPPYHDFGLISAILSSLAGNAELTMMSPLSFLQRPALWFELIDRVRATHTAAPNFGYELAVRKTTAEQRAHWDLSSLKVVMSAAEPVRADTTGRFLEAFAAAGLRPEAFCPAYGLAEHTVGVTIFGRSTLRVHRHQLETQRLAVVSDGPDSQVLMGCGKPTDDVDVRIVDPELRLPLGDGQVGEIWVDSPSKAQGYWGAPEASRATFQAHLAGVHGGRGYLRTGDLGFMRDGELYVCGRAKDLLILAGRNIHPQDIEDSLRDCHRAIRAGGIAAFAIDTGESEALAVLAEVLADTSRDELPSVVEAVRAMVLKNHQVRCSVVVLGPPGSVSKTTSGKVQRSRCRARLLDGSLQAEALLVDRVDDEAPVGAAPGETPQGGRERAGGTTADPMAGGDAPSPDELLVAVRGQAAAVLGIHAANVDIDQPLGAQGLSSIGIVELASHLSQALGTDVYPVDVFNHPTVRGLATMLTGQEHNHQQRPQHAGGRYAVIGAGCAGVAAASQLIEQGATEVVLFEANDRVGGKVLSHTDEQGRVVEVGQAGFSIRCQRTLRMAARLGLHMIPTVGGLHKLRSGGGHEQLDLRAELAEATDWSRQVMAAAGIDGPTTLAELHMRSDLGCGIDTWCRKQGLPATPLVWHHWWTGFGYGPLDDSTPAACLVSLASLTDAVVDGSRPAMFGLSAKGGNDRLWSAEVERLQTTGRLQWRPSCPVRALHVTDDGVVVETEEGQSSRFNQVVVACPPEQARQLLPVDDERVDLLDRFQNCDYFVTLFTAQELDLPEGYGVLETGEPTMDGRPLQLVALGDDRFVVSQYGIDGADTVSSDTIRELTTALGGRFGRVLRHVHYPNYFPHFPPADWDTGVLGGLEQAQGQGGIVLVGSYLSFEMVEHAVAHAQTTVARHCAAPTTPTAAAAGRVDEPVAVVGMACRFPGDVVSAAGLWDLVSAGKDVVGGFPTDRGWDLADLFDPDPDAVGKTYTRGGAFLSDPAGFDADFFGISAREAQAIDPQQRVLLEVCWEALETAGIDPGALAGSNTGVFVGTWAQFYGGTNADSAQGYGLTGVATSMASGRVAYLLGLQGPAITVDTACSSSLVATHLACQSLRNGESGLALAGGVTIMATPATFTEFARQRGLAADGRCKAFAAAADGTGWGEGAAVVVLERLGDARRNNHPVLAVIAGSAVNQDGASDGLTAPNGPAQQRVITQAAANAGLRLDQVDVVEAHGTGTTLGDPIEAGALLATYGAGREPTQPLWLGSIKSNLGHTQGAAGAAGLIKMVTALNHDILPPTLHVDAPSPHVDWSAGSVRLLTRPTPWPQTNHPKTAAISSFGISGTNAHLILQQAPAAAAAPTPATTQPVCEPALRIWPISARSAQALAAQADRLHTHLIDHPGLDLTALAYSLATTRTQHPYRAAITEHHNTEDPREDLLEVLLALRAGQPHPRLTQHHDVAHRAGKIVFVLPGQGAQYPGMGLELYQNHRAFADALDEVCAALDHHLEVPLREVIFAEPDTASAALLKQTAYAQPALFAVGAAMHAAFAAAGITADALLGHSIGELTAAYIAGVLSLDDAAVLVSARGRLMQSCPPGAMLAVQAGEREVVAMLRDYPGTTIAAINSPTSIVVSGLADQLDQIRDYCAAHQHRVAPLAVSHAFHSAFMETALPEFEAIAAGLSFASPTVPIVSNLTGRMATPEQLTSSGYWTRHLREPVRFHDGVSELLAAGEQVFVELSPHPVLAPAVTDTLAAVSDRTQSAVITTLHRDRSDLDALAAALARLHNHGHSPSWSSLYPHTRTIALPTYPFQHRRYWLAPTPVGKLSAAGLGGAEHPLLGAIIELAEQGQVVLSGRLCTTTHGWLAGHRIHDSVVFPGTGFIDVVLHAGQLTDCPVIDELILQAPLVLVDDTPVDVQITVNPADDNGRRGFTMYSRYPRSAGTGWKLHATGTLSAQHAASSPPAAPTPSIEAVDPENFYAELAARGYRYDPPFRSLHGIGHDPAHPEVVYAELRLPADTDISGYGIHPALLDAALHPLAAALDSTVSGSDPPAPRLPFAFAGVTLHATAATRLHVQLTATGADTFALHATDPTGAPVITIQTLTLRAAPDTIEQHSPAAGLQDSLFHLGWPPLPDTPRPAEGPPRWAVLSDHPEQLPTSLRSGPIHSDLAALAPCPELVIWALPLPDPTDADSDPLYRLHTLTGRTLVGLQQWLARPDTVDAHLVIISRHAVRTAAHDRAPDLAHAAVWALIHSAQNEHPGRITALDTDDTAATDRNIINVISKLAASSSPPSRESQLVLRDGTTHVARLTRTPTPTPPPTPPTVLDPDGTVLITGGTGALGAIIAEHLVTNHHIRHLLLVSRSGPTAATAGEVHQRLTELGAQVAITACDAGNPTELAAVLEAIPTRNRLTAIVHAAGVLDDAVITELTPNQLETVLTAKADAAWHLHNLTANQDLAAFVLFSSAAATLGAPGQGNYAAANAFLDALAHHRHQHQQPATSLAWGYWQTHTGMAIDVTRLTRTGMTPLTTDHGLALFDTALTHNQPALITTPLNAQTLARHAENNTLPPILSALTTARPPAAAASPTTLTAQLATQTPQQQLHTLTSLVTTATATVLAHTDPNTLDPERPFTDIGIDSLTALELRYAINRLTGLTLPPALVFDHPTPSAIARHLIDLLDLTAPPGTRGRP